MDSSYLLSITLIGTVDRRRLEYISGVFAYQTPHLVYLGLLPEAETESDHIAQFRVYAYGMEELFGVVHHALQHVLPPDLSPGTIREAVILAETMKEPGDEVSAPLSLVSSHRG